MRIFVLVIAMLTVSVWVQPVTAVTVVRCKDAGGNISFREHCPPDTSLIDSQTIAGAARPAPTASLGEIAKRSPVLLFVLPDCDSCDLVRHQLESRKIPFTEHDVGSDASVQEKLKALSSSLTVPAVAIGKQVLTGYNRNGLDAALKDAGYPLEGAAPDSAKR